MGGHQGFRQGIGPRHGGRPKGQAETFVQAEGESAHPFVAQHRLTERRQSQHAPDSTLYRLEMVGCEGSDPVAEGTLRQSDPAQLTRQFTDVDPHRARSRTETISRASLFPCVGIFLLQRLQASQIVGARGG